MTSPPIPHGAILEEAKRTVAIAGPASMNDARGNQHAKKLLFPLEVAGLAREMMILSSSTSIGGGAVCGGGGGGGGEVRRHAMANNWELMSKASILGPSYQLLSSLYHLTPMIKESILYPSLPPSHLITVLFEKIAHHALVAIGNASLNCPETVNAQDAARCI